MAVLWRFKRPGVVAHVPDEDFTAARADQHPRLLDCGCSEILIWHAGDHTPALGTVEDVHGVRLHPIS